MDPVMALREQGGIARWSRLRDSGVKARSIKEAVDEGNIHRIRFGLYAVPDVVAEYAQAKAIGASVGCFSAAALHGLWVHRPCRGLHVSAPRTVAKPLFGRVHRTRESYGTVVPLDVCLRQVLNCLPPREALVVVESAVVQGRVTIEALRRLSRGRGSRRADAVIAAIDPASMSVPETLARQVLLSSGYKVVCQRRIEGVGRIDLEVEDRLLLEIDGKAYHSDEASFIEDRRRWNELTLLGRDLLVLPAREILDDPESVLRPVDRYFTVNAAAATRAG
jgi:very-short-patch-repair endonuclease